MIVDGLKLPQGVFLAEKRDAAQLGEITADAFQEDPFNLWLFGNFGAMEMTFRTLAKHVYTPRGVCYRLGNMAAAMWMMAGGKLDIPMHALPAFGAKLLLQGSAGVWPERKRPLKRWTSTIQLRLTRISSQLE